MAGSRGSCGSRLPDMCYSQRLRSQTFIKKSSSHVRSSKVLAEDETSGSRCDSSYHRPGNRSSFMYSTSTTGLSKPNYTSASRSSYRCPSNSRDLNGTQSSSILAMQNARHDVTRSSDESGSDHDIEVGESLVSGISAVSDPAGWDSVASSSANKFYDLKSDLMERDAGVSRNPTSHYVGTLSWRDRYMSQPARADGSTRRTSYLGQGRPHGIGTIIASHKSLRKGSSSKAPHIDDLTAPLCLDKKARLNADRVCKSDLERRVSVSGMSLPKNSNVANSFRPLGQSAAGADYPQSRKKSNTQVSHRRRMRPDDQGAMNREMSSIGAGTTSRGRLSNLVCSSAAVVLPSISSSALSSLVCSSAADVLPSVSIPSAVGAADRNRKTSRAIGLSEEGEAPRGMWLGKGPMGNGSAGETLGSRGGQSQEQVFCRPHVVTSRSVRLSPPHLQHEMSCHRRPESGSVAHNASLAFAGNRSLPTSYRHRESSAMVSRNEDGLVSSSRSSNPFPGPIPAFGEEVSNQRGIRRRSLYGNQAARLMGVENEFPNRNRPCSLPSSSPWSVMHEMQYMQPNFSRPPPTRPPPLPPLATIFTESSASESGFPLASLTTSPGLLPPSRSTGSMSPPNRELEGSRSSIADAAASDSSASSGETRPRRTVEGLSEILSALECLERDEDLSYEQVLMLEATILLGGVGLPDRHREMRVDIDNMSYEELLDLEERIGNVNTGLSEESIVKCMRITSYASPGVSSGYVPQDIEIKCSICQEEFEEAVELGVLECGHSHHISCIKQWLSQKNQCPICKSSAIP